MQMDFHYYATYCAAFLAGYSHEEALEICYSDQFVDLCSVTLLGKLKAPRAAATTQLQLEMMDLKTDLLGLQDITRIWSSFHFLPGDLYADPGKGGKRYKNKYRLICGNNSDLVVETVELARGRGTQATGIAMHILADTWAHTYFAGTPSLAINNTGEHFYEIFRRTDGTEESRKIIFRHNPSAPDDLDKSAYTNSLFRSDENNIMNLGHGRAGHLPDYSFVRYRYLPSWGDYGEITKDNPSDYLHAFCQMVYAMRCLRGEHPRFDKAIYDVETVGPWYDQIARILVKRQLDACADWKALGEKMSGCEIPDFDIDRYQEEYIRASEDAKEDTFLGKFFLAAMAQKSMVTAKIFQSGNMLAGFAIDFDKKGFRGMRDYRKLAERKRKEGQK